MSGEVTPEILIRNIRIHQKEIDRLVTALAEKLTPPPPAEEEPGMLGWRRVLVGENKGQVLPMVGTWGGGEPLLAAGGGEHFAYRSDEVEVFLTGVGMSQTEWAAQQAQHAPFVARIRELRARDRLGLLEGKQAALDEAHTQAIIDDMRRDLLTGHRLTGNKPMPY